MNKDGGNIGVLIFNSAKGWPEDRFLALKDIVVPAHRGTVTVTVTDLSAQAQPDAEHRDPRHDAVAVFSWRNSPNS